MARSSITGRFVTAAYAVANAATTTISRKRKERAMDDATFQKIMDAKALLLAAEQSNPSPELDAFHTSALRAAYAMRKLFTPQQFEQLVAAHLPGTVSTQGGGTPKDEPAQ